MMIFDFYMILHRFITIIFVNLKTNNRRLDAFSIFYKSNSEYSSPAALLCDVVPSSMQWIK